MGFLAMDAMQAKPVARRNDGYWPASGARRFSRLLFVPPVITLAKGRCLCLLAAPFITRIVERF